MFEPQRPARLAWAIHPKRHHSLIARLLISSRVYYYGGKELPTTDARLAADSDGSEGESDTDLHVETAKCNIDFILSQLVI